MRFTFEEKHSALWLKLKEHMEQRIEALRLRNDGMLDELTTANVRGQIKALKELVALETDPPDVEA